VSTSQSLVLVQAINDPEAEANIHAISSTNNFASEVIAVRYDTNPDTKKGYYLIGSTQPRFGHNITDGPTPIVANTIEIIPPTLDTFRSPLTTLNGTATTSAISTEPTQTVTNINKTISNAYNELFITINNKTNQTKPNPSEARRTEKGREKDGIGKLQVEPQAGTQVDTGGNQISSGSKYFQ
jgi:hypothetical protein